MQLIFLRVTLLDNKIFMSEQKKVFLTDSFINSDEEVICLYDINYISGAKNVKFKLREIANSEESQKISFNKE